MRYELISEADFAALPIEKSKKFLALESICRRNLNALIDDKSTQESDRNLRMQYMSTVSSAAEELGVKGVQYPMTIDPSEKFDDFILQVIGVATKLRLNDSGGIDSQSVRLSVKTMSLIEDQIQRLKKIIVKSDLPEDAKQRLIAKLRELSSELTKPRVSFGKVMAVLAIVATAVGGTTGFLASAPDAIATITALIGADKEAEEKELKRLGLDQPKILSAPPKQIPDNSDDDEIPF